MERVTQPVQDDLISRFLIPSAKILYPQRITL
jgi:hypothetical protein